MASKIEDNSEEFERMLDISRIERAYSKIQNSQVNRLREQLAQLKLQKAEELAQKDKLISLAKKTNEALEVHCKNIKNRADLQEERIRTLQSLLRVKKAESASESKLLEATAELERTQSQDELKIQLSEMERELLIQRQNTSGLQNQIKNLKSERDQLRRELQNLIQFTTSGQQSEKARQLEQTLLQLEEERKNGKMLVQEVSQLTKQNEFLAIKLHDLQNRQQTNIQEAPQCADKASEFEAQIQKLTNQLNQLKQRALKSERMNKNYKKQIQNLKNRLSQTETASDHIESQKVQAAEFLEEQKHLSPSLIDSQSIICSSQKKRANIDSEEYDEDSSIKVKAIHVGQIQSLNKHWESLPPNKRVYFLNMLSAWSEQKLQRLEPSRSILEQD